MNQQNLILFMIFVSGLALIVASLLKSDILFQNKTSSKINERLGERKTQFLFIAIGILVLVMGYFLYASGKLQKPVEGEVIFQL